MPFKPGHSGNLKGAPKRKWTWSGVLASAVEEKLKDGLPVKIHVAKSLVAEAMKGNVIAIKELMNRMDGMPPQQTDLTSGGEKMNMPVMYLPKRQNE